MSTQTRKYRLQARADAQRLTRERIVAATSRLHRDVGPARTTIADIARIAGVQRLTVYNHFPKMADLLGACQGHFLALHPPPNLAPGVTRARALERLEAALAGQYRWYRSNRAMEHNVHADRHHVPELDALLRQGLDPALDGASAAYAELIGTSPATIDAVRGLVRVALEFGTWELLAAQGMRDGDIARLFRSAVACVRRG